LEPSRRQALLGAKLGALVTARWGDGARRPEPFPGGAALVGESVAWVLVEDDPERALGKILLWAQKFPVEELNLLVEARAGMLARRAQAFADPPKVWRVDGTTLELAEPDPVAPEQPLDRRAAAFAELIRATGAEALVEHGVLRGEVLGLEVARVVVDVDGAYLEVGVGKHDRHTQRLVHADVPTEEALAKAVATVREHRRVGAPFHPLNRLAPERWLRARLVDEPQLVGGAQLAPVPSPVERDDLRKPAPAPAAGVDTRGHPMLVVCSTGMDVDLVPVAADAWLADARNPRLVLVVPERDDHPLLRPLAAALRQPAEVRTVPDDWRRPMPPLR
jgi:hypothetical protein